MYQESRPIIKESNRSKSTTIFNRLLANDLFGQKRKERNELILSKLNVCWIVCLLSGLNFTTIFFLRELEIRCWEKRHQIKKSFQFPITTLLLNNRRMLYGDWLWRHHWLLKSLQDILRSAPNCHNTVFSLLNFCSCKLKLLFVTILKFRAASLQRLEINSEKNKWVPFV